MKHLESRFEAMKQLAGETAGFCIGLTVLLMGGLSGIFLSLSMVGATVAAENVYNVIVSSAMVLFLAWISLIAITGWVYHEKVEVPS